MIALLLAQAIAVGYQIPQRTVPYKLSIELDGFIPVFIHRNDKVDLDVDMTVKGLPVGSDGSENAVTDVTRLKMSLAGSMLPFDRSAVADYFPETVTFSPQGKVINNSMPKSVDLPVHLPGVDVKRFPDVTFLAVEFPTQGVMPGTAWTFSRDFSGSPINYTVTPISVTDDKIEMKLSFTQDYTEQEGSAYEIVKDPRDAVSSVATHVVGSGTVEFDRKLGLVSAVRVVADATGDVTDLESKAVSHRELKTTVTVSLAQS